MVWCIRLHANWNHNDTPDKNCEMKIEIMKPGLGSKVTDHNKWYEELIVLMFDVFNDFGRTNQRTQSQLVISAEDILNMSSKLTCALLVSLVKPNFLRCLTTAYSAWDTMFDDEIHESFYFHFSYNSLDIDTCTKVWQAFRGWMHHCHSRHDEMWHFFINLWRISPDSHSKKVLPFASVRELWEYELSSERRENWMVFNFCSVY